MSPVNPIIPNNSTEKFTRVRVLSVEPDLISRHRILRAELRGGVERYQTGQRKQGRGCLIIVSRSWANGHAASFFNPSA